MNGFYYEIELKKEAFSDMIREAILKKYGSPIHFDVVTDNVQSWFRSPIKKEAEIAKEITGLEWTEKEYYKPEDTNQERPFTWGT